VLGSRSAHEASVCDATATNHTELRVGGEYHIEFAASGTNLDIFFCRSSSQQKPACRAESNSRLPRALRDIVNQQNRISKSTRQCLSSACRPGRTIEEVEPAPIEL